MTELVPVKRALISVSDKSQLADFAGALARQFQVRLISTGGSARFLREQGLSVADVSDVTGFPEMMDGRIKTLHPKVHGGLLAIRDNPQHAAAMKQHGIEPIDLVCINLYPFSQTIAKPSVSFEEAIENIDIGGPSMVRSAAKNHQYVLVITSPQQYAEVLEDLRKHNGCTSAELRRRFARQAFAHTAAYDATIAAYLTSQASETQANALGGGPARFGSEPRHGAVATTAPAVEPPEPESADRQSGPSRLVQQLLAGAACNVSSFMHDILLTQATMVAGTEAAAFLVKHEGAEIALETIDHIRPDESDEGTRAAAIKAFQDMVGPCATQGKDGAVEVGSPDGGDSQYCLITLHRNEDAVVYASAVICRCHDLVRAKQRLRSMQVAAGYFDLYTMRSLVRQWRDATPDSISASPDAQNPRHGLLQRLVKWFGLTRAETPSPASESLPATLTLSLVKKSDLRYGENPHQKAALYVDAPAGSASADAKTVATPTASAEADPTQTGDMVRSADPTAEASVAFAKQHHGKDLSYINLLDADAALAVVKEFAAPAACIVKHATPCGVAMAEDLPTAFRNAFAGDPLAAFGGIVALNRPIDLATAQAITSIDKLLEVIAAPSYAADALELLKSRWKNVRLLEVGPVGSASRTIPSTGEDALCDTVRSADLTEFSLHRIARGYLVQQRDMLGIDHPNWKVVTRRPPTPKEMADLEFAWLACKHVKSNAIVIAGNAMMYGSGAGQQDRVNACRIAIQKAGERCRGAVAASDAFFPFPDGPQLLLDAGITAIIHPGGSLKDKDTLELADQRGAAMVLTGQRHFRH